MTGLRKRPRVLSATTALAVLLALALGAPSAASAAGQAPPDSSSAGQGAGSTTMDSQSAKTVSHFPGPDSTTVAELRKGDLVLVFRHSQTDWGQRDADIANFADRSAQRNLSAAGDSIAARIGRAIRKLEIPIGEVLASPMWRCRDTATLAFGHCDTTITLFRRSAQDRAARIAYLSTPITDDKNLVLVTHQDVLIPIIPGLKREELKESDAFVVRPLGDGKFDILAQVTLEDWERLAAQVAR
jgi:phosphohistidine phosphatase SixA